MVRMDHRAPRKDRQPQTTETRGTDPFAGAPPRVQPGSVAAAIAALYALGSVPTGSALVYAAHDNAAEGILLWAIAAVLVALPTSVAGAILVARAERILSGRIPPQRLAWLAFTAAVVQVAHWAPLVVWAPTLVVESLFEPRLLLDAVAAFAAWFALGGVGALTLASRRWVERRSWAGAVSWAPPASAWPPSEIPTSWLLGLVHIGVITVPTAAWTGWAQQAWWAGNGSLAVVSWALAGAGVAVLAGGAVGSWLYGATAVAPRIGDGDPQLRRIEVVGAVFAAHFVPLFLACVSPVLPDVDFRYCNLWFAFLAVAFGVCVAAGARSVRPELVAEPTR